MLDSLLIGLGANFLNIGVFSGPYPSPSPPTVLPEAGSIVVVVVSPMTMSPPLKSRILIQTIP